MSESFSQLYQKCLTDLRKNLERTVPPDFFFEVYEYALFPPGKLFRPMLANLVAADLGFDDQKSLSLIGPALEFHHVYTLLHDDLPCMDDDDLRRGRASTHKKFSEAKALLAGDGLLNASYHLLHQVGAADPLFFKAASWCFGPKGLIAGQAWDLIGEHADFKTKMRSDELKTARLFQAAFLLPVLAANKSSRLSVKTCFRLGMLLGRAFQLQDDIDDGEIESETHDELLQNRSRLQMLLIQHRLPKVLEYIENYWSK